MFIVEPPVKKKADEGGHSIGNQTLDHLINVVKECIAAGRFKNIDAENLAFTILSSLHGMSALFCKDRTSTFTDRSSEQLIRDGNQTLVTILERL